MNPPALCVPPSPKVTYTHQPNHSKDRGKPRFCTAEYAGMQTTSQNSRITLVRPTLEYSSPVWDPHTHQYTNSLEAVQRSAARFVVNNFHGYHDYSPGTVTNILQKLYWETLQAYVRLIMLYKILHNEVAIPPNNFVTAGDSRTWEAHKLWENTTIPRHIKILILSVDSNYSGTCCHQNQIYQLQRPQKTSDDD